MMKKFAIGFVALAMICGSGLRAQDLSGKWQGTLKMAQELRLIFDVHKGDKDGWSATMYNLDLGRTTPVRSVTLQGSDVRISVDAIGGSFAGTLSADGKTMTGMWTQVKAPFPLVLVRATPETAWKIPVAPEEEKPMAADADPSFSGATIKVNASGGPRMQGLTLKGRQLVVRNGSLEDLIAFAYRVQVKQIVGGPDWMRSDRYDIDAVPDQPGVPGFEQLRSMIQKLLADRFKLTLHNEKREMPAYVLTVAKSGPKLTPSQMKGTLPGFAVTPGTGGVAIHLINGTMTDFTSFLQMLVLHEPVLDRTGLSGRFASDVTFTPDETQFDGHAPKLPPSDVPNAPDLSTAIEREMGLTLAEQTTSVGVILIDHVEKPSAN